MLLSLPHKGACPSRNPHPDGAAAALRAVEAGREGGSARIHCSVAMGNTQEKSLFSGGGESRLDQTAAENRGKCTEGKDQSAPGKAVANGTGSIPATVGEEPRCPAVDTNHHAGSLPPHLARIKNEGNQLFKHGQFGDALDKYSQAIEGCAEAGISSPQDLCILYSNRAACYLKDGNSTDCIQDCTKALDLQPYSLKPLLRRAMAYESLERYRNAYVDYKTVLQIDTGVQAAHDSVHRITRMLIEQDGMVWREKLPEIPVVPLSVQQEHWEKPVSMEQERARAARVAQDEVRRKEARVSLLKQEGNDLVKRGHFHDAMHKYTECIAIKHDDCALYTNRAISLLKLSRFQEAKQDCDAALLMEPTNKKAFYRRALAHKGLQDYLSASSDLQEVLELDPNVREAEAELLVVTSLLRKSLMDDRPLQM
ncbi:sperm-associated antigen 1A-like [Entelurus aequoreus]|uniref:sperm-associated antigen 1A n=1 Tax=Entelurus aequoreus TaxID=161455 RepID=UPI002B1D0DE6|nr:sperm-associated antigen 1A [Entelurus aequoreus]XP_061904585.1 sperm-associated antigen 1A-like [Entelurus aequoreus]